MHIAQQLQHLPLDHIALAVIFFALGYFFRGMLLFDKKDAAYFEKLNELHRDNYIVPINKVIEQRSKYLDEVITINQQ